MEGIVHVRIRRPARHALAASVLALVLPATPVAGAAAPTADAAAPSELPPCQPSTGPPDAAATEAVWRPTLDEDGAVTGYALTIVRGDGTASVRTGRRGFAARAPGQRVLVGERSGSGTRLTMIDGTGGCRMWQRELRDLAYPVATPIPGQSLQLTLHRTGSREFAGLISLDAETGDTDAIIDGDCAGNCDPSDGSVPAAAYEPAGAPRPVPSFSGGAWAQDKSLAYRWSAGGVPPSWAKGPIKAAADDSRRSSIARSPVFVFRSGAGNGVSYGGTIPPFCGGIACASRSLPSGIWGVWLRPHGSDFSWGTLRWCQKSSTSGCFDIRRVALHELGHVSGLDHPESGGFRLEPHESVMHAISPAKPKPGSTRHAYGRCDVATLQELYDVPNNRTPISVCSDIGTRITLSATKTRIERGQSVKLKAVLKVASKSAYRRLAGNPLNGRSVKLKYRRAGSDGAWTTAWMRSTFESGRYELTIDPVATWEFKAVFPEPPDEGLRYSRSDVVKVKVVAP